MDLKFWLRTLKKLQARMFSIVFRSPQRAIVTGMVVALVISMGTLEASGNLFQPIPDYSPYASLATYHVRVATAAISVGETTNITAFVTSYILHSSIEVNVSVIGPLGSGINTYEYATINTDSHGNGSVTLAFPGAFKGLNPLSAIGTYKVVASFAQVYTTILAYSHFVVFMKAVSKAPVFSMTPGFGPVGTSVTVQGYNFDPDSNISLYYNGSQILNPQPKITADPTGFFLANITIPTSSGINSVKAQDQFGNYASSFFGVQLSSQPGPRLITSTSMPIMNGSAIANFTSTVGVQVVLMGTNLSNVAHSDITVALYDRMPLNLPKPNTENSRFYDVQLLNVTDGNATISIEGAQVKNGSMNSMQYWNGNSWVSAVSIYVSGDTISGIIPVRNLGNTSIVIGHTPSPSHIIGYITIVTPIAAFSLFISTMVIRRRKT